MGVLLLNRERALLLLDRLRLVVSWFEMWFPPQVTMVIYISTSVVSIITMMTR